MIGTDSYRIIIELNTPKESDSCDYRDSPINITSIDNPTEFKISTKANSSGMSSESIEPLRAKFLGEGVIRLFREFEEEEEESGTDFVTSSISESSSSSTPFNQTKQQTKQTKEVTNDGDDTMVSIIAVPTYFTATDLLGFIGESYMKYITHIRILKSEKPNRFLVLIKFNDILKTAEFQLNFNGKPFNSMEPESCHVIFVKSVHLEASSLTENDTIPEVSKSLIPFLLTDPFTSPSLNDSASSNDETLIELPTCPVCLERMDSAVTGLLTIACQHTFHCQCLSKWSDDTCPICRYSNNVSNQKVRRSIRRLLQYNNSRLQQLQQQQQQQFEGASSSSLDASASGGGSEAVIETNEHCMDCSNITNLWICLICGNVGCDRYAPEQHSLKHFINSGHCFAMELNTSRVWDYAGDNYVHRLVANESDGKIVELPEKNSRSSNGIDNKKNIDANFDKIDEVGFEYSQLLISQLASQREFYESLLNEKSAPKSRRGSSLTDSTVNQQALTNMEIKVEELTSKMEQLTTKTIPNLKTKISNKDNKIQQLAKDLNSSNILNDALSKKIDTLTLEKNKLENTNKDLTEQVNDLMFYLESQEKLKNEPQDVRDGTVVIKDTPKRNSASSKKKRK